MDDGDAGVVEFEGGHLKYGQFQNESQEHSNHASMAEDTDMRTVLFGEDPVQRAFHSTTKGFDWLCVGDGVLFQEVQPIKGALIVFLVHFFPFKTCPISEIDLP